MLPGQIGDGRKGINVGGLTKSVMKLVPLLVRLEVQIEILPAQDVLDRPVAVQQPHPRFDVLRVLKDASKDLENGGDTCVHRRYSQYVRLGRR